MTTTNLEMHTSNISPLGNLFKEGLPDPILDRLNSVLEPLVYPQQKPTTEPTEDTLTPTEKLLAMMLTKEVIDKLGKPHWPIINIGEGKELSVSVKNIDYQGFEAATTLSISRLSEQNDVYHSVKLTKAENFGKNKLTIYELTNTTRTGPIPGTRVTETQELNWSSTDSAAIKNIG